MKIAVLCLLVASVLPTAPTPQPSDNNIPLEITEFVCSTDQELAFGRIAFETRFGNVHYRLIRKRCLDI